MPFAADADVVLEPFDVTDESRGDFHFGEFFLPRSRINVGTEVENGEKAGEAKPHIRIGKISTWAYSACNVSAFRA